MARIRWRWAGIGILSLIGLGAEMMPDIRDWLASGIIWGIAFVWLIATIIYWRKHRKTVDKIKQPKLAEIKERVKVRKQYLPQLKQLFGDYINRVEVLAKTASRVYDLEQYKRLYPIRRFYIFLSHGDDKGALLGQLESKQIWKDNLVFRQVEDEDVPLQNIGIQMDNLATNVRDKQVKDYAKGIKKATHIAYSYVIYCALITKHYETIPFSLKVHFELKQIMINRFRQHQSNINARIDELLEGAEDEQ